MQMIHFTSRRKALQQQLNEQSALLVRQDNQTVRNHDVHYPFHPSREFFYLSGFDQPNAWLLITKNKTQLWSPPMDPKKTLWEGPVLAEKTIEQLDIDVWDSILNLEQSLPKALAGIHTLHLIGDFPTSIQKPEVILDGKILLDPMRIIKDPKEIEYIRMACRISAKAHNHLMGIAKETPHEAALEGQFIQSIMQQGARSLAYPSIVASGKNACTLHYVQNNQPIARKELILVDAGCEYQQYASDITRTFPACGRFSAPQQALYEAVLDTQLSTINLAKPGVRMSQLHQHAVSRITQPLIDLDLICTSFDNAIETKAYEAFFPHRTGHTMGLNVHDIPLEDDTLLTGMVITVEPGLYIPSPGKFQDIGIRIEDDILITHEGHENLSLEAVKSVDEIHHLMS
jgi:Xaa-Pro aminopeptidase